MDKKNKAEKAKQDVQEMNMDKDKLMHLICAASMIAAVVFAVLYFTSGSSKDVSELSARERLDNVLLLDEGEEAKIVEINDAATAKDGNVFYKNTKDGDVLYVFQNRVAIYRPDEHRVINVAPYLGGEDFDPTDTSDIQPENIVDPGSAAIEDN